MVHTSLGTGAWIDMTGRAGGDEILLPQFHKGKVLLDSAPQTQQRADIGKREFEANCAACHGRDGKGGGPIAELLKRSPPT